MQPCLGTRARSTLKERLRAFSLYHIVTSTEQQSDGNYKLANKLKVTETKIKSLLLESSIRHNPADNKAILGRIVQRIIKDLKPDFSDDKVSILLENPIERREFEYAVKRTGHLVEYGINREIINISPLALFRVVLSNADNAKDKAKENFKEAVQNNIEDQVKLHKILNESLTFRQKLNEIGKEVTSNGCAVKMLSAAVGLLF